MAKRWQQPWNKKSKKWEAQSWIPEKKQQLQSHKRKDKPKPESKKQRRKIRIKNVTNNRAKPQKTKPSFNPKNKDKLIELGKETKKNRTRSERPKLYDEVVANWDKNKLYGVQQVINLRAYYESEEIKDKITRRKDASGTYKAPTDSKYYKGYVDPYIAIRTNNLSSDKVDRFEINDDMPDVFKQAIIEYNISSDKSNGIIITDYMDDLFQQGARNWLSNKISVQEFEQSFKVFEQGEELIVDLYKGSKYNGTDVTVDDYKSMFYSIFRNMLQKSKSQYDSNTIRSYMLGNGIDDYVDGGRDSLTPDILDEIAKVMNPKIELVRADIEQLADLLAGNTPPKTHRKIIDINEDYKVGDDKTWFDDKDVMQYFKEDRLGDMKVKELKYLSGLLPTKGELIKAQKLLVRAKRKMKIDFKVDTIDLYARAADVIEDYGSKLGINALTDKLVDQIETMNVMKLRGEWNY